MFLGLPALHVVILAGSSSGLWHLPSPLFCFILLFITICCTDFYSFFVLVFYPLPLSLVPALHSTTQSAVSRLRKWYFYHTIAMGYFTPPPPHFVLFQITHLLIIHFLYFLPLCSCQCSPVLNLWQLWIQKWSWKHYRYFRLLSIIIQTTIQKSNRYADQYKNTRISFFSIHLYVHRNPLLEVKCTCYYNFSSDVTCSETKYKVIDFKKQDTSTPDSTDVICAERSHHCRDNNSNLTCKVRSKLFKIFHILGHFNESFQTLYRQVSFYATSFRVIFI